MPNVLAKNTTYYTAALTFQRVLAFLYFTLVARVFGPEDLGKYVTALSFSAMFAVLADVGLSSLLTREVAKTPHEARAWLSKVLSVKLPLSLLTLVVIYATMHLFNYPPLTRNLICLGAVIVILDSFSMTFWGVWRGLKSIKWESLTVMVYQVVLLTLGGLFIWMGRGVPYLGIALIFASFGQVLMGMWSVRKAIGGPWKVIWNTHIFISMIVVSFPFALAGIFTRIYTSFDSVMLSKMAGDAAVGWYSIPMKILLSLQFLPMAFTASLYPAMSSAFVEDKERLVLLFEKAMRYLMLIGFPIAVGIIGIAEPLIVRVWGSSFLPAVLPLRLLMASLIIVFLSFPLGSLLNATNQQLTNTRHIGIMLAVNDVLNFIFIPFWGVSGAAFASLVASAVLFYCNFRSVCRIISIHVRPILAGLSKIFLSSIVMVGVVWVVKDRSLFLSIPLGAIIYSGMLVLTRSIGLDDVRVMQNIFRKSEPEAYD